VSIDNPKKLDYDRFRPNIYIKEEAFDRNRRNIGNLSHWAKEKKELEIAKNYIEVLLKKNKMNN
jgi:hypothetical protein